MLTVLRPTVLALCEATYSKDPKKIGCAAADHQYLRGRMCNWGTTLCARYLRVDALAQILAKAGVRAHSKVLVMEDGIGLVTAAAAERLAGKSIAIGWRRTFHGKRHKCRLRTHFSYLLGKAAEIRNAAPRRLYTSTGWSTCAGLSGGVYTDLCRHRVSCCRQGLTCFCTSSLCAPAYATFFDDNRGG